MNLRIRQSTKPGLIHTFNALKALKCMGGRSKLKGTVDTVLVHIFNSTVALLCESFRLYIVKRNGFKASATARGLHKNKKLNKYRNALYLREGKIKVAVDSTHMEDPARLL